MKKIIVALFLFCCVQSNSQKDTSSRIEFLTPPDSTAIGSADGKLTSNEIGIKGGTIISDDGRIELVFPADALTKTTTIIEKNRIFLNGRLFNFYCQPCPIKISLKKLLLGWVDYSEK